MKRKLQYITKFIIFVLIAATLFCLLTEFFERKPMEGAWNYNAKLNEFYALPKDSLDYVVLGSSHAYCTINPLEVYNQCGLGGFVLASQLQPLDVTYYYLKEVYKTQSPKYVYLEGLMAYYDEKRESAMYDAIDALHFSWNKIDLIFHCAKKDEIPNYLFTINKFHGKWKDMDSEKIEQEIDNMYSSVCDTYRGYAPVYNSEFVGENLIFDYDKIEANPISEKNMKALNDILELTKKNGSTLVLLIAPGAQPSTTKSEYAWASENNVEIIDLTQKYDEMGIVGETDYYDDEHLNIPGAKKASIYFANIIKPNYDMPNKNIDKQKWDNDYIAYTKEFAWCLPE